MVSASLLSNILDSSFKNIILKIKDLQYNTVRATASVREVSKVHKSLLSVNREFKQKLNTVKQCLKCYLCIFANRLLMIAAETAKFKQHCAESLASHYLFIPCAVEDQKTFKIFMGPEWKLRQLKTLPALKICFDRFILSNSFKIKGRFARKRV